MAQTPHGRPRSREERPRAPEVPEDVTWFALDRDARAALRSLPKEMAERVGGHLAMAGLLVDEDPEQAREHAKVARRLASRVAVVREAMALTAYACGDFETALAELRAYRRLSGDQSHLPLMADCERGLGRPERALELVASPEASSLPPEGQRELRIVTAGARSDLGQDEAALFLLEQDPALRGRERSSGVGPSVSALRLWYAYAETLSRVGRGEEAARWFRQVAEADVDGVTDAAERVEG
jgi:tetratricopeptide (TPR) repeat protein